MIGNLVALIRIYRDKLLLILLILALPWAWAFFWVPWWVNLVCIALVPVAGALLIFRVLPAPPQPRRADDDPVGVPDAQIRKMRKMSLGINNLLGRWSQVSNQSRTSIEEVQSHVDEVIRISETSVVEIGKKFVAVTRKTRKQVDHALGLLEHTRSDGTRRESRPLPELVSAYEELMSRITENLARVAETAEQLERRHESMREDFRHVDTLLDQLSAHDSQIGMMALNTSVSAATSSSDVVSVSDQIRTLSLESKALTRDIRRTLEQVRSQHQQTHGAVRQSVAQAREAAGFASAEAEKLGREMLFNGQEVAETLSQIGALGNEIQKDINDIIVALQYQDITQQKLQRLKNPLLTDLMASLRVIFDETRVLSTKLQGSGLVDHTSTGSFRVALASGTGEAAPPPEPSPPVSAQAEPQPEPKPQGRRKGDEAVEIF
jgi:ABC-type transporter Mla subunit MlaD